MRGGTVTPTFVGVCPTISLGYSRRLLHTARFPITVVDNTAHNRGVAASWNIGAREVVDRRIDWLVVLSAAVRFGPAGGVDFLETLDDPEAIVVEAGDGIGWHLIAFRRDVFEQAGLFDENCHPAYWEDLDMGRRIALTFGLDPPYWRKVPVDATVTEVGHGKRVGRVTVDSDALIGYMVAKHGGVPGPTPEGELYAHPFGDPDLPWSWWPGREHPYASAPYRDSVP